jgi:hypothetical protein
MTPLPAATGQLTGSQLEGVLLPTSVFPSGYASPTTGPITSGGALTTAPATYDLAKISCATFIQHFGTTGFGETAMVTGSVAGLGLSGTGQAFDQLVYQFATPADATAFIDGARSLAARCASFSAQANGATGKFTLSGATGSPVGGHPTVSLTETGTLSGEALSLDTLLCASGVDVFGATAVGVKTAAPTAPATATIVYKLMQRQPAVALLN